MIAVEIDIQSSIQVISGNGEEPQNMRKKELRLAILKLNTIWFS
jgi:hypothetical protein